MYIIILLITIILTLKKNAISLSHIFSAAASKVIGVDSLLLFGDWLIVSCGGLLNVMCGPDIV